MKRKIVYLVILVVVMGSCSESKKDITQLDNKILKKEYSKESEAYVLLKNKCFACHSINTASHDDIIAPPMVAIKRRYSRMYNNKEDFVDAVSKWAFNPKEEKAIMRGAVSQFKVMPKQVFKIEELRIIAAYIYDNKLEKPAWFSAHEKEMHSNKKRMGKKVN